MNATVRALILLTVVLCTPVSLFAQATDYDIRARRYWVDSSTGLMWAARDNGRDVDWRGASSYCFDLQAPGYDWRLPTIGELEGIYDPGITALGPGGKRNEKRQIFHVKGDLSLTGASWSASQILDAAGRRTGRALLFEFANGRRFEDESGSRVGKRALCVRGQLRAQEDHQVAPDTRVRGYWVDPSTGLMWAGRDNFGRDLNWRQAAKYCLDLNLAGSADWRLPTISELEGIYDKSADALGLGGKRNEIATSWHVKGDLFLTGWTWSASHLMDARGRPTGWGLLFDFNRGRRFDDELGFRTFKRALCVRGDVQP